MASRVDKSNMLSESWQNVYDLINDKSNVSDPTTLPTQSRKWVYSREPDIKGSAFKGFPYIIVNPAVLDFGDEQTGNRQIQSVNWSIEVEVVTSDRGFNNEGGKGQIQNDAISDDIIEAINNETNRKTLAGNGLRFFKPNVSGSVVEELKDTLVYRRSFLILFGSKKKVF